jgi:hypothetical protein
MLALGGVNLLSGKTGFTVAKTIVDIVNKEKVELKVEKGSVLEIQVGEKPVINGKQDTRMRIGCGSATIGLFARRLKDIVDEAIILDHHITGLLSEHPAGAVLGMKYSGIIPVGRKSTVGRYFGQAGSGWGDTKVMDPPGSDIKNRYEHLQTRNAYSCDRDDRPQRCTAGGYFLRFLNGNSVDGGGYGFYAYIC